MIDVENQDKQKPELIATLKLNNITNSTGCGLLNRNLKRYNLMFGLTKR